MMASVESASARTCVQGFPTSYQPGSPVNGPFCHRDFLCLTPIVPVEEGQRRLHFRTLGFSFPPMCDKMSLSQSRRDEL